MTKQGDKNLTSEVNNRLNSFFDDAVDAGEAGPPEKEKVRPPQASPRPNPPPEPSPLFDLNAIILSIDWEITDDIMTQLLEEIERLKAMFRQQKLPLMFLQLHGSVGKYISARKASAHPDSIKLLHSIYAGLQETLSSPDMPEVEKKKILAVEVDKFKRLKEQILNAKAEGASIRKRRKAPQAAHAIPEKTIPATRPASPSAVSEMKKTAPASTDQDVPPFSSDARLEAAVEELKQFIKEEITALKMELKSLIEND